MDFFAGRTKINKKKIVIIFCYAWALVDLARRKTLCCRYRNFCTDTDFFAVKSEKLKRYVRVK
jgi:hypothetical protein